MTLRNSVYGAIAVLSLAGCDLFLYEDPSLAACRDYLDQYNACLWEAGEEPTDSNDELCESLAARLSLHHLYDGSEVFRTVVENHNQTTIKP